ncbi:MAG: RNA-binding protein [Nitrospirota bacterium]
MAKKLYVGNLSYSITEDSLRNIFSPIGEVTSVKVITDPSTGRSKGFGFVEMATDQDAEKAIASLHGTTVMERVMNVSEARPQSERRGTMRQGGGKTGQRGFNRGEKR